MKFALLALALSVSPSTTFAAQNMADYGVILNGLTKEQSRKFFDFQNTALHLSGIDDEDTRRKAKEDLKTVTGSNCKKVGDLTKYSWEKKGDISMMKGTKSYAYITKEGYEGPNCPILKKESEDYKGNSTNAKEYKTIVVREVSVTCKSEQAQKVTGVTSFEAKTLEETKGTKGSDRLNVHRVTKGTYKTIKFGTVVVEGTLDLVNTYGSGRKAGRGNFTFKFPDFTLKMTTDQKEGVSSSSAPVTVNGEPNSTVASFVTAFLGAFGPDYAHMGLY